MAETFAQNAHYVESMAWAYTQYKNARTENEKLVYLKSLQSFTVDLITEAVHHNTDWDTESLVKYVKAYASFLPNTVFECLEMERELKRLEAISPFYEKLSFAFQTP